MRGHTAVVEPSSSPPVRFLAGRAEIPVAAAIRPSSVAVWSDAGTEGEEKEPALTKPCGPSTSDTSSLSAGSGFCACRIRSASAFMAALFLFPLISGSVADTTSLQGVSSPAPACDLRALLRTRYTVSFSPLCEAHGRDALACCAERFLQPPAGQIWECDFFCALWGRGFEKACTCFQ